MTKKLSDYRESHGVSHNRLISGNLKDLQQMIQNRKQQVPPVAEIREADAGLSPELQQIVSDEVRRVLEGRK